MMADDSIARKRLRPQDDEGVESKGSDGDDLIVSFPGERFNFTYLAASSYFQKLSYSNQSVNIHFKSVRNYKDVFDAIVSGSAAYGVVPLESSSRGTIHHIYDKLLLSDGQVSIVGCLFFINLILVHRWLSWVK